MIAVHLYLLCYNEEHMIHATLIHYQKMFQNIEITVCDNESTDDSIKIAEKYGCNIHIFKTDNKINDFMYDDIKSNLWKKSKADWIVTCDMDEFLCINQQELEKEDQQGTTILTTQGYNMVADSKSETLGDININEINQGWKSEKYSKRVCFKRESIDNMRYTAGCHSCSPIGTKINYSKKKYLLYHFKYLGYPFLCYNYSRNYHRSHDMRQFHMAQHYTDDKEKIKKIMDEALKNHMMEQLIPLYKLY